MNPECITRLDAAGGSDGSEQRGRLAQGAWPQVHADERAEGPLGGPTGRTPAAHGLLERLGRREPRACRDGDDIVDPPLDKRKERLETGNGRPLLARVLGLEQARGHEALEGLRIGEVNVGHHLLQALGIDANAARVLLDRTDHAGTKPRNMREEPLVGRLAQREIETDVARVDADALP